MILFFNPRSAPNKPRIPLSILSLMRMFPEKQTELIDGNLVGNPLPIIRRYLRNNSKIDVLAITVMPGPQLQVAIPLSRIIHTEFPELTILWGGYFPTFHSEVILRSGWVDYVIKGFGERTFVDLINAHPDKTAIKKISGVSFLDDGKLISKSIGTPPDLNTLPLYPWHRIQAQKYLGNTYLGSKTINYHTSYGCPFNCNFCAVNSFSNHHWSAEKPAHIFKNLGHLLTSLQVNGLEFHDNNFFVSQRRIEEIADRLKPFKLYWWGEGRIDTLLDFSENTWKKMKNSGLKMVFTGAESGSDETLREIGKEEITTERILEFASKCKEYSIIPEFSFMIGAGSEPEEEIIKTEHLIRNIKNRNQDSIIVLYLYSPVAMTPDAHKVLETSFSFPKHLSDWEKHPWKDFDMRRGSFMPWFPQSKLKYLKNFETVLQARFPAITAITLPLWARKLLPVLAKYRYSKRVYSFPIELKIINKLASYHRIEETGL